MSASPLNPRAENAKSSTENRQSFDGIEPLTAQIKRGPNTPTAGVLPHDIERTQSPQAESATETRLTRRTNDGCESATDARPIVTELKQTCSACPSQWSGKTADGRILYVRYRFSKLTAQLGADTGDEYDGVTGAYLPVEDSGDGDGWDGFMETAEMMARTASVLDWSQCVELPR